MRNLQLSHNVKQYFVNALKGLGLRDKNSPEELSNMAIANLLDNPNTTPFDIYWRIRLAVLQRLRNDAFTTKALQKDTAFDRNTVKLILNNLNVDQQVATNIQNNADALLRDLSASGVQENGNITNASISNRGHIDEIVENVIMSLMSGMPEQNLNHDDPNHDEKQQAVDLWEEIRCSAFQRRLIATGHYDENKFNAWIKTGAFNEEYTKLHQKFHVGRIRDDLIAEVKTRFLSGGTDSDAKAFLNTKIRGDELKQILNANKVLLDDCKVYCQRRCQAEEIQYDENQLTLFDVLAAAGSAKTQIITFFQTRSQEQKQDQIQNPKTTEVKKENKIGNVMGKAGRELVKEATGSGVKVDFDEIGLKGGRKGPWRGYKSLFESILRFIGDFYGKVPTIGFVQNLMTRELGYSFDPEGAKKKEQTDDTKEPKQPWQTNFKEMPKEYYNEDGTLNLAGKFYNKTKARLLNDRLNLVEITQKYQTANTEVEKQEIQKNIAYLQIRVVMADGILKNKMPDPNSHDFNNPDYYIDLEKEIIAEEENENINEYIKANIKDAKVKNANDYMVQSLDCLREMNGKSSPDAVKLKREMAKVMFNLEVEEQSKVSDRDLDGIVDRFYNSKEYLKMRFDLNNPTNITVDSDGHIRDEYKMSAVEAMSSINQFVEKDLKENAMKSDYEEQKTAEYREQIHTAAVHEMDGGMTM